MERKISEIYDEIKYNFNHSNHTKTLTALEEYFSLKSVGITDNLLFFYIQTLANLGRTDEALNYLDLMIKMFPNSNTNEEFTYERALIFILGDDLTKAQQLLESIDGQCNEKRYYYDLAKIYLHKAQYEKAVEYFNKCIDNKKGEKRLNNLSKENLEKINRYLKDGTFLEIEYQTFKNKGLILEPGHIVYTCEVENIDLISLPESYKQSKIPYMIWKIEEGKCYAFPVTNKIKTKYAYILKGENYPNFNFDRTIKDRLVCIDENNIKKVLDKINKTDLSNLLYFMYKIRYFAYLHGLLSSDDLFLKERMQKYNAKKYDVLVVYDIEERKSIDYFIYEEDDEKYYTVEVDFDSNTIKSFDTKEFDKSEIMFRVLKLSDEQKEMIINQLSVNYQKIKRY